MHSHIKSILISSFIIMFFVKEGFGQDQILNKSINLTKGEQSLETLIQNVSDQTGLQIAYSSSQIDVSKHLIIEKEKATIKDFLIKVNNDLKIEYKLVRNTIILYSSKKQKGEKNVIHGFVRDSQTGERLIGANIYNPVTLEGTSSNEYGFYSIAISEGFNIIECSYIGYNTSVYSIILNSDTTFNFTLESNNQIKEVKIIANQDLKREITQPQMSMLKMDAKKLQSIPVMMGERDIVKAIQLMPGVKAGSEANSGVYVRGGNVDQNLILIDGVPVYNPNHFFGFFSILNDDAIQNVTVIKGSFPAEYGGRLSSIVDIQMKEGNSKEFHGSGTIGLMTSKLSLEGPIVKDKASFFIAGRSTYLDLVTEPFVKKLTGYKDYSYQFYDFSAKVNYKFSEKNRVFFSYYQGNDKGESQVESYIDEYDVRDNAYVGNLLGGDNMAWENKIATVRWNSVIGPKLFSNITISYSDYKYETFSDFLKNVEFETDTGLVKMESKFSSAYLSRIQDIIGKIDVNYYPNSNHSLKFGLNYTNHKYQPGISRKLYSDDKLNALTDTVFKNEIIRSSESYAYIQDKIKIGEKVNVQLGIHFSNLNVKSENYYSLEPRISLSYALRDNLSFKGGYSVMKQYVHFLTLSKISLASDLWVPATDNIPPQMSQQYSLGLSYLYNKQLNLSIEGYYKTMDNLIAYKEGASYSSLSSSWEEKVERGNGYAYGIELFLEKRIGDFTGWFGYTYSKSKRKFENINFGEEFDFKYDRPNELTLSLAYKLNRKFDFGLTWIFHNGNVTTLGLERYGSLLSFQVNEGGNLADIRYYERNSFRMPDYHRLDLLINYNMFHKWGTSVLSLGIYNVYNRNNIYSIETDFNYDKDNNIWYGSIQEKSLLPILPSLSYRFNF